jgi:tetratricopeptide (TPR) repeat protein
MNLADTLRASEDEKRARALFEECLQAFTDLADLDGLAWTMNHLARMERDGEKASEARELLTSSLSLFEKAGDFVGVANCLSDLSRIESEEGDFQTARAHLRRGLLVARREGLRRSLARLADDACALVVAEGHAESALRLAASVESFRKLSGFPRPQVEWTDFDATLSRARAALNELEAEVAWRDGRTMSIDDAVEEALAIPPSSGR